MFSKIFRWIFIILRVIKGSIYLDIILLLVNILGIHRDVVLYIKPIYFIKNVVVRTDYVANIGNIGKAFMRITD